jgi:AraC-like DNA-binding protein
VDSTLQLENHFFYRCVDKDRKGQSIDKKLQQFHTCITLALESIEYIKVNSEKEEETNKLEKLFSGTRDLLEMSSRFLENYLTKCDQQLHCLPQENQIGTKTETNTEMAKKGKVRGKKSTVNEGKKFEKNQKFLKKLNRLMERNFSNPDFNVEQLARLLDISEVSLYRKIHGLTGESPCEFIRSFRLQRAFQLLENHSMSVIDTAFEVGFNSHSYFTKCFKEKFHRLPSMLNNSLEDLL